MELILNLKFFYVFLFLCTTRVEELNCDNALQNILKTKTNSLNSKTKYWFQYHKMLLYTCLKRHISKYLFVHDGRLIKKLLECAETALNARLRTVFRSVQDHALLPGADPYTVDSRREYAVTDAITRVSGQIFIADTNNKFRHYHLQFNSDPRIRINITVHMLYSYGGALYCNYEYITFKTIQRNISVNDRFCFYLSSFNFYPKSRFLMVTAKFYLPYTYILNSSFTIFDMDTVFSSEHEQYSRLQFPQLIKYPALIFKTDFMLAFFIEVHRFKRVGMKLTNNQLFQDAIVYNGPSFQVGTSKFTNNTMICSTFQCIVQLVCKINTSFLGHLNYFMKPLKLNACIKLSENQSLNYVMSNYLLKNSSQSICFKSPSNYEINGTLEQIIYNSAYSPSCLYGGLVVGELSYGTPIETYTICDEFNANFKQIYSKKSTLFLLLYGYLEHCYFKVRLKLSLTMCKTLTLDPCQFIEYLATYLNHVSNNSNVFVSYDTGSPRFSLKNNVCTVLQFITTNIHYYPSLFVPVNRMDKLFSGCYFSLSTDISQAQKGIAIQSIHGLSEPLNHAYRKDQFRYTSVDYCETTNECATGRIRPTNSQACRGRNVSLVEGGYKGVLKKD